MHTHFIVNTTQAPKMQTKPNIGKMNLKGLNTFLVPILVSFVSFGPHFFQDV